MKSLPLVQRERFLFAITVTSHLVVLSVIGNWLDDPIPFGNDNLNFRLPYQVLVRRSFEGGDWPFWDLYSAGGMPLSSIFMSSSFNPLVVLLALLSIAPSAALLLEVYIYSTLGVIGMWLWLGSDTWVYARSMLSLAWVNSLTIASAFHLNFEVSTSVLVMPWLMLGITRLSGNRALRLAVLTLAVVAMATSGYLGLAPFILYGVVTYGAIGLAGKWLRGKQEVVVDAVSNWRWKLVEFLVFSALVVGAISISLSETLVNLTAGVFLDRSIDPFIGSLDWRSLSTMVSTGASETYGVFDDGGHLGSMFIPVVGIAGLSWGAVNGGSRYWAALAAALVTFVLSLSPSVPWSRWLVSVVPFLEDVRFHGFSLGIVLFFLATAAAEGFRGGVPRGNRYAVAFLVVVSALTALTFAVDRTLFDRVSVTLLVLIVGLLTYLVLRFGSHGSAAVMVLVASLTVVQIVIAPGSWTVPLIGEDRDLRRASLAAIDRELSVSDLPVP